MKPHILGLIFAIGIFLAPVAHAEAASVPINDPVTDTLQLWSEVAEFLSGVVGNIASILEGHELALAELPSSQAAAADLSQNTGIPTSTTPIETASSNQAATTTVINYITDPVERVIDEVQPQPSNFVTQQELTTSLLALSNSLAAQFTPTTTPTIPQNIAAGGNPAVPYAAENSIDTLSNVTITNANLTASEIPDLSGSYLSLNGGTLTGTLNVPSINASTTNYGVITATNSSTTNATSTNLFSALATFTTGIISSLSGTQLTYTAASTTNLSASGEGYFGTASTTNLIVSNSPSGFLQTNAQGAVSATSTFSTASLFGTLGTVNGTALPANGAITVTAASSTLLGNANTWTGLQQFGNASSTLETDSSLWLPNVGTNSLAYVNGASQAAAASVAYPLQFSGGSLSLAFGTTTANSFSQLQTLQSGLVSQASSTVVGNFSTTGTNTFSGASNFTGLGTWTNGFLSQASSTIVGPLTLTGTLSAQGAAFASPLSLTGTTGTTTIASGQGFSVGGSQFVVQQGSGNVGIGTTTIPSSVGLSYDGSNGNGTRLRISNGSAGGHMWDVASEGSSFGDPGSFGIGDISAGVWRMTVDTGGGVEIGTYANSGVVGPANGLVVSGSVGIGTSSPGTLLDVWGSNANTYGANSFTATLTGGGSRLINANTTANNGVGLTFTAVDTSGNTINSAGITGVFTSHTAGAVSADTVFQNRNAGTVAETMRITSAGNVGIGTSSPVAKLDVLAPNAEGIRVLSGASNAYAEISLGQNGDVANLGVAGTANQFFVGSASGDTALRNIGGGSLLLGTGSAAPAIAINTSNYVGVGTTSPFAQLSVFAGGDYAPHAASTLFAIGSSTAGTATSTLFDVTSGGFVGIGTTTPTYKLDVNGDINIENGAALRYNGAQVLIASTSVKSLFLGGGNLTFTPSGTQDHNTGVGFSSLSNLTTGIYNTAAGYGAEEELNTGIQNTAVGLESLNSATSSSYNVAIGTDALGGSFGTFGAGSLGENTAVGTQSLFSDTWGNSNTGLGFEAGFTNTTGSNNIFIGQLAGYDDATSSSSHTAITGSSNIIIGSGANILPNGPSSSNELNIGNLIFATGLATGNTLSTGNVGIGTTSPAKQLSLQTGDLYVLNTSGFDGSLPEAVNGQLVIGAGPGSGAQIMGQGSSADISLENKSGAAALSIPTGTAEIAIGTLAAGTANSLCYNTSVFAPMYTLSTCSSDQRLKQNITALNASSTLAQLLELNPVSFYWNPQFSSSSPEQFGLIAQQVQEVWPNLISTTSPTALTPDGTLSLNFNGLFGPIVASIQEIANIGGQFEQNLIAWLGNAQNGIVNFFAQNIHAENEVCIGKSGGGETCLTGDQLAALLSAETTAASPESDASQADSNSSPGNSESASSTVPNPSPDASSFSTTPPVLQVNGANPAIIQVGARYNDPGAMITGPQADLNLGIATFVSGSPMSPIQIDTSSAATDTIDYVATDQNGLTATSTRTVIIEAPSISPSDTASSNSEMATSTDATTAATSTSS